MLRDADIPTPDGRYAYRPLIIESAVEGQASTKWAPSTDELPTTHEHHVYRATVERNGKPVSMLFIGVREKAAAAKSGAPAEPDNLNDLDDATLEVEAAKAGVKNYPRTAPKAKRVQLIREAREKKGAANA